MIIFFSNHTCRSGRRNYRRKKGVSLPQNSVDGTNGERVKSLERRNHPVLSDHPVLNGRKRRAFLPIVMQIGY